MKSRKHEAKTTEASKPRFQIEKLEERIAPSKGGIPGPPTGYDPPGQDYCFTHRHDRGC